MRNKKYMKVSDVNGVSNEQVLKVVRVRRRQKGGKEEGCRREGLVQWLQDDTL